MTLIDKLNVAESFDKNFTRQSDFEILFHSMREDVGYGGSIRIRQIVVFKVNGQCSRLVTKIRE